MLIATKTKLKKKKKKVGYTKALTVKVNGACKH